MVARFSVGSTAVDMDMSGSHGELVSMPAKPALIEQLPRSTMTQGGAVLLVVFPFPFRGIVIIGTFSELRFLQSDREQRLECICLNDAAEWLNLL